MKRNKLYSLLVCLAICTASVFALGACDRDKTDANVIFEHPSEHVYVLQATETKGSLKDALTALQKDKKLTYKTSGSAENEFLTTIDSYTADTGKNEFWAIYTSLGDYNGVDYSNTAWGTFEYEERLFGSACFGINGMPLIEGELYILTLSSY